MFPIITPVTLNMPELVQAGSLTRLPWPDGSVISARLAPTDTPGTAMLILGSYRLLAQVPPATPMGEVWLMLVSRQMPARFAMLSDAQVLQMLAGMLESDQAQEARQGTSQQARHTPGGQTAAASMQAGDNPDWPNLSQSRSDGRCGLPWHGESSGDGNTMLWYGDADDQPRGMLHRQVDEQSFTLSGRVDLDRLGGISFSLRGNIVQHQKDESGEAQVRGWNLTLHTGTESGMGALRETFDTWLAGHRRKFPDISGELNAGLPESGGGLTERTA